MTLDSLKTPPREFPAPALHVWPPQGFEFDYSDTAKGVAVFHGPAALAYAAPLTPGALPPTSQATAYWILAPHEVQAVRVDIDVRNSDDSQRLGGWITQAQAHALYVALGEVLERIPAPEATAADVVPEHGYVVTNGGERPPAYGPLETLIEARREIVES